MKKTQLTKGGATVTHRESASVQRYLNDMSRIERSLVREPDDELVRRIKSGDQRAFNKLVESNLGFVVSVAKQEQGKGAPLLDLINAGNLGLIKAVRNFDPSQGFKFISYAVWYIKQEVFMVINEYRRIIRLPINQIEDITKLNRAENKLLHAGAHAPTDAELAAALDVDEETVGQAFRNRKFRIKSLDEPHQHDEGESDGMHAVVASDAVSPVHDLEYLKSLQDDVRRALSFLKPSHQRILLLYFGIGEKWPMSLKDIGSLTGRTPERMRQIKDESIDNIKKSPGAANILRKYLMVA